ncbi:MAG TPA: hypothetical protein DF427_12770 [Moraxellaceae bacterium]|nr:hypothetical protein [Moraxellaceae bacterium]
MSVFDLAAFRALPLPDEQEIMAGWQGDVARPVVSIICTTFNHQAYLDDAIRGFLLQKTGFPFEVVIHDDASTDATQTIIQGYAARYPHLIRPVLQFENQFSKGRKPIPLAATYARGEYLAICEGDDFWGEQHKLAVQHAALQAHPECNLCFHPAWHGGSYTAPDLFERVRNDNLFYPVCTCVMPASVIIAGAGNFIPTASIIMKKSVMDTLPDWFYTCPVGDYFFQSLGVTPAGAVFLPQPMCCYRVEAQGSWSLDQKLMHDRKVQHWVRMRPSIAEMGMYLGKAWQSDIRFMQRNADEFLLGDTNIPVSVRVQAYDDYARSTPSLAIRLLMAMRRVPGALGLLALLPYKARIARLLYLGRIKLMKDIGCAMKPPAGNSA